MKTIKYTPLSGPEQEISDDFIMHGMAAIWNARVRSDSLKSQALLDEAHRIMSALLYGTIKREEKL